MDGRHVIAWGIALKLGASACHSSGSERPRSPRPQSARRNQYLIERDELGVAGAQNLYDVVRIQRPVWLTRVVRNVSGNDAIVVYLDERIIGSLNILREMPVHVAQKLEYLSPTEAQLRFGPKHGVRAAIVVETPKP